MATENMVKAGRAGLTFGGDWDETFEYERLVGVRYDNKLFFSKKPVPIGTIPEDGEYWFLAYEGLTDSEWEAILDGTQQVGDSAKLGGKDASEYVLTERLGQENSISTSILEKALTLETGVHDFSLSGASYSGGDLPLSTYAYGMASVYVRSKGGVITVVLWGTNTASKNAVTPAMNHYNGTNWTGWDVLFSSNGGRIKGTGRTPLGVSNTASNKVATAYYYDDTLLGELGVSGSLANAFFRDASKNEYGLLHTGNKPSGTYTGNGSTVNREIATGGIGDAIAIKGSNGTCAFVYKGAVGREGATVKSLTASEVDVNNSTLYIISNSDCINADGVTYTYQVL